MKSIKILVGLALALGFTAVHAIPVISVTADNATTSAVAGVNTINFNDGQCAFAGGYSSCTGDFLILANSIPGQSAKPVGTDGNYLSVPNPKQNGEALLTLGAAADYFGLYWGSIDTYNGISFYLGGALIAAFSGSQLPGLTADGNQVSINSNRYINFDFSGGSFDAVKLTSNGFAFESDNHAYRLVASVPEPATGILMLLGLLGLIGARRRLR